MRVLIRVLGLVLFIQVLFHVLRYLFAGMPDGFSGLGMILDSDLVILTVALVAMYVTRD